MTVSVLGAGAMTTASLRQFILQGIAAIFRRWTALQMAIEGGWGGHETEGKVLWLQQSLTDYLIEGIITSIAKVRLSFYGRRQTK